MSVLRMKLRKVKTKVRRRLGHELDQTPRYLRQKELLRKTLASERLARVRVSTVDGFQGAEASRRPSAFWGSGSSPYSLA